MKRFLGIWALMAIFMAALCQPVLEWLLNTADGFMAWPLLCGLAALLPAGLLSVWLSETGQGAGTARSGAGNQRFPAATGAGGEQLTPDSPGAYTVPR